MNRIRYWVYIPTALLLIYFTVIAVVNSYVPQFHLGYIDFAREEVGNYSNLVGVIFGLIGIILLVETLWLQQNEIRNRFDEKIADERDDFINVLNLLHNDIILLEKDIELRSEKIKEYIESEKEYPFGSVPLLRTTKHRLGRYNEFDRHKVFRAFKVVFGNHRSDWLKEFNKLYNILEYLPEFFNEIYDKTDSHIKDMFARKQIITEKLLKTMDMVSIVELKSQKGDLDDKFKSTIKESFREFVQGYYAIVEADKVEGEPLPETRLDEIEPHLHSFIKQIWAFKEEDFFIELIDPIVFSLSELRKLIFLVKNEGEQYISYLEEKYDQLCQLENNHIDEIRSLLQIFEQESDILNPNTTD